MTLLVDTPSGGICALRDEETDTVLYWFEELVAVHGDPFDNSAWDVPMFEELWPPPLSDLVMKVAEQVSTGSTVAEVLAYARHMADTEYELKRGRGDDDAGQREAADDTGSGGDGAVATAASSGGGVVVPGGPEDGVAVGKGREVVQSKNRRRPPKVSGGRGSGEGA